MASVIDDHLLLDLLIGSDNPWLLEQAASSAIYTTGSWYYRVASAADRGSGGALSRRIAVLRPEEQRRVRAQIAALPDSFGLVGPRRLVPVMAGLRPARSLNYLGAEAVALARLTKATIAVRTDSPPLRDACRDLLVDYRTV